MVKCSWTIRTQNSKVIIITQWNINWIRGEEKGWSRLNSAFCSLHLCLYFLCFPLEHQEKRILWPRAYRHACAWKSATPKQATIIPISPQGTDEKRPFCGAPISLLAEIRDSAAPLPLRHRWHRDSQPQTPTAIMEIHLSCKLICNYDFGQVLQGNPKGFIEWHFPMSPSPDKWDKTLQMCSGPRQHRGPVLPQEWKVLTKRCSDRNSTGQVFAIWVC